ncbi:hypothetical protein [Polyangium aurulentum]|uniref:hypothetical protein n=1 Tax=Polyangium aurulentum TaxID=2567896 RepID=UPI0010AE136D|nr:hypothetical protein [Polyangium aurulentum]UQA63384.1 hypothetical protein E8A73_024110 [Polyangium aurulentum]
MPFDKLQEALAQQLDASERWLSRAGILEAPRGNVPQSQVDRLARMGVNYGIQSQETMALTDLGQVLRTVAPWTESADDNPLAWRGEAKWIGFWILLQAAGDVHIPLLRAWPTEAQTTKEVAAKLTEVLSTLARRAGSEDRQMLRQAAEGTFPERKEFKAHTTLYPYVEPLRDLGYIERTHLVGGGAGYCLTEAGVRLKDALNRFNGDTEALLRSGSSRVFLLGEGHKQLRPAPGIALAEMLATMPPELHVLRPEEVPLDPAVLLTQAKLLRDTPGAWIDRQYARLVLEAVGQRGAKVAIKHGSSAQDLNVAWGSTALLENEELWAVDVGAQDPFGHEPSQAPLVEAASAEKPAQPAGSRAHGTTEEHAEEALAVATEPQEERGPDDPEAMLRSDIPAPLRLWLQYVDHILTPPAVGQLDVARWGGLATGLTRLKVLLLELSPRRADEKRSLYRDVVLHPHASTPNRRPHCIHPISCLEPMLQRVQEHWVVHRTQELWLDGDKDARRSPLHVLERGLLHAPLVARRLRSELIDAFLDRPHGDHSFWKSWDATREATRSIIHDAIADGAWSAQSLRACLHRELRQHDAREAAGRWLELLFTMPWEARYTQRFRLPLDLCDRLGLHDLAEHGADQGVVAVQVEQKTHDDGKLGVELVLRVQARSGFEARILGRHKVQALLAEQYAQRVVPEPDAMVELHERPDDEQVVPFESSSSAERVDREEPQQPPRALPGLSFASSTSSRSSVKLTRGGVAKVARGQTSAPQQRVLHARRELLDARRPGLRSEQRVMLAWMATERLINAGKEGKGETVTVLAAAASLSHLRSALSRILSNARAGLWLMACLEPDNTAIQGLFARWLSDLPADQRALIDPQTSEAVRRARAMDPMPPIHDEEALRQLWAQRADIPPLRDMLNSWAPLAAAGLQDFLVITGEGKTVEHEIVGDGGKFSEHFRHIYEEVSSLFAYAYEVRNRTAHGGGVLHRDHDPGAAECYQRFVALVDPVLDAAERWVSHGMSLEQVWGIALDKAQDLAGLPHGKEQGPEAPPSSRPVEADRPASGGAAKDKGTLATGTSKPTLNRVKQALSLERIIELLSF